MKKVCYFLNLKDEQCTGQYKRKIHSYYRSNRQKGTVRSRVKHGVIEICGVCVCVCGSVKLTNVDPISPTTSTTSDYLLLTAAQLDI